MNVLTILVVFLYSCTAEPLQQLDQDPGINQVIEGMKSQILILENKLGEQIKAQENKIKNLSARLETCQCSGEKAQREVAFTAALQPPSWGDSGYGKIGPIDLEITLVYGKVLTNVGGAYDSHTGVFSAPVKGVYFFTFTTYSWVREADIGVRLMKNNEEVLLVWETQDKGDNEDYASNSVLLELEVGDRVYMRLPKGFQVAASIWSNIHTFSGFLLYSK